MKLVWTDLETTGADRETDLILEVGMVVTDTDLREIAREVWLIKPDCESRVWLDQVRRNKVVREMHSTNGLVTDILFKAERGVSSTDNCIYQWLTNLLTDEDRLNTRQRPYALAGSGVGHFDKAFMLKWMPLTMRHFNHWVLDVGVVRRSVEFYAPALAERAKAQYKEMRAEGKTHRALEDAELHAAEMRFYREHLFMPVQVIEEMGGAYECGLPVEEWPGGCPEHGPVFP